MAAVLPLPPPEAPCASVPENAIVVRGRGGPFVKFSNHKMAVFKELVSPTKPLPQDAVLRQSVRIQAEWERVKLNPSEYANWVRLAQLPNPNTHKSPVPLADAPRSSGAPSDNAIVPFRQLWSSSADTSGSTPTSTFAPIEDVKAVLASGKKVWATPEQDDDLHTPTQRVLPPTGLYARLLCGCGGNLWGVCIHKTGAAAWDFIDAMHKRFDKWMKSLPNETKNTADALIILESPETPDHRHFRCMVLLAHARVKAPSSLTFAQCEFTHRPFFTKWNQDLICHR